MSQRFPWRRLLGLSLVVLSLSAAAQALTLTGTIDPSDPQMPVVFISTPNCTGQGSTLVYYEARQIQVTVSGTYDFSMLSDDGFASLYVMSVPFDPNAGLASCLAADNSGNPVEVSVALTAGTPYIAVPFDDTFDQLGGEYELSITGPGAVIVDSIVAIPTLSQWGLLALVAFLATAGLWMVRRRHAA